MKIFVAGGTGAVGKRLVPLLVARGHSVVATTRSNTKIEELHRTGAEAVMLDGLNRAAVMEVIDAVRPDVIVHQRTALASMKSLKKFDDEFKTTNRLRTTGTEYLIDAAR